MGRDSQNPWPPACVGCPSSPSLGEEEGEEAGRVARRMVGGSDSVPSAPGLAVALSLSLGYLLSFQMQFSPGPWRTSCECPLSWSRGAAPTSFSLPDKALPTGQRRQTVMVPQRAVCPLLAPFGGCTKPGGGGEDRDGYGEAFCCPSEPGWEGTVGKMSPHQLGCCKGAPVPGELGLGESGSAGLDSSGASPG